MARPSRRCDHPGWLEVASDGSDPEEASPLRARAGTPGGPERGLPSRRAPLAAAVALAAALVGAAALAHAAAGSSWRRPEAAAVRRRQTLDEVEAVIAQPEPYPPAAAAPDPAAVAAPPAATAPVEAPEPAAVAAPPVAAAPVAAPDPAAVAAPPVAAAPVAAPDPAAVAAPPAAAAVAADEPAVAPSPSEAFDCEAGFSNWKAGWSEAKKDWCCTNKGKPTCEANGSAEVAPAAAEVGKASEVAVKKKPTGPCAEEGENCLDSQCCASPGMQCYAEQEYWGTCAYQCDPKDMKDPKDKWACKEVGERTPKSPDAECSEAGENCFETMCCKDAGFQCYSHNKYFAGCSGICDVDNIPKDPEGGIPCVEIGDRQDVPDSGPTMCSWSGEDCSGTRCCNDANMKCYQKDGYFAGCKFEAPKKWVGGDELGSYRGWDQVAESVAPEDAYGTSLYCFVVISPPREKTENTPAIDDQSLVNVMEEGQWGIFQCDEHSIFDGAPAEQAEWISIANTDIFIEVWGKVKDEGKFWDKDWTVKVDCDAVFFPDRLKAHISQMNPPKEKPIYFKNCDFKFGFMGSLEIFSEKAMELFFENGDQCTDKIGHDGGEDFYMMTCMDALGVYSMQDVELLSDKYTTMEDLILDDVAHCNDGWKVAFHPYKDPETLANCYAAAVAATPAEGAGGEGGGDGGGDGGEGGDGGGDGGGGDGGDGGEGA